MKRIKTAVQKFGQQSAFYSALKDFFETLNLKINYLNDKPIDPGHLLKRTYKSGNPTHALMEDVYCLGMIDNASIKNEKDKSLEEIKKDEKDYDGVLIFGVTLKKRDNGNLPSRSQLAELTRSFNREFYYTPVVVVFRYSEFISIANIERTSYKQTWREGEKTGKVSILREININKPHTGHIKIIKELDIQGKKVEITIEGRKKKVPITTFDLFYQYWQSVFNVALLNKQFYKELSDWYFWAIDEVVFPGGPALKHFGTKTPELREHNAQNLIRLLTRILFVWFIKEKGLIPEEVFDENYIKTHLLKEFREKKEHGNYEDRNSRYYRAILQNLFFATLNQEQGKREFRKNKQHMNITNLMRYKRYFKDPKLFIDLVEKTVPFMNGGLFECLDHPIPGQKGPKGGDVIEYIDGFSDRSDNVLTVPDNIFFGTQSHVNLSEAYGEGKNKNKDVTVKGLINLLDSYKFTIDENTPVEQDIALDPELLGRVFENLLASYNPETKTTARKQTGSFYTPREIVDYMVDESLIAYLKNDLNAFYTEEPLLDERLHQLFSYDDIQPFEEEKEINQIISSIDQCKILDPACGSGAFPMGALQKMVHVIHKIDPKNKKWKERQIKKLDYLEDSELRGTLVDNIEEAFSNNELDYGRKLFLIENCIYGVDIQPIAIQISKLRFFISLIVDQKIDKQKPNFGVRPLPNLETKFVAANSLIGLDSTKRLKTQNVINLEKELSDIRHRLFSAKTPKTKRNLREEDKRIREELENELIDSGWKNETAKQIACWDPYDQNQSSDFFDPEWMFDVGNGFDIVIGNPPYIKETTNKSVFRKLKNKKYYQGKMDIWYYFASVCIDIIKQGKGILTFIATNNWVTNSGATKLRKKIISETRLIKFIDFSNFRVFESAGIQTMILMLKKQKAENYLVDFSKLKVSDIAFSELKKFLDSVEDERFEFYKSEFHFIDKRSNSICFLSKNTDHLINQIRSKKNFDLLDQEINTLQDLSDSDDLLKDIANEFDDSINEIETVASNQDISDMVDETR